MSSRHRAAAKERKAREEQARREAEARRSARRRWRWVAIAAGAALVALVVYGLWLVLGQGEDAPAATPTPSTSASAQAAPSGTASPAATSTDDPIVTESGWGASSTPPPTSVAEDRTWTVTMSTNMGDIVMELDGAAAPQAVASFLSLAGDGYYDSTECHRLTTEGIYILQCGDPLGTGAGGPAYSFGPIENAPADGDYPAGTLAMARASASDVGADAAANSMGSQFFIVYEDSQIPADAAGGYTVFGRVVQGLGIVEAVAEAGTITGDSDGRPALSVIVNEVSVS
ncbi:peptidylprolyl isomerase [Demequina capsici]|uniref:Peptidylprolyl isomerase n=1 Tax=Demequina capsici TaxID=3075620 RepID=A0AA96FFB0_9MICO|nr:MULTISPECIES: peptidylprolyl isomerase [unclassified Demequina]WNM25756.1 peptidylprolyl isomerase [Demequina sp. OYTSA14]WNM28652.1 peptidylprolyl isomerase [Demequina sp. PMTSA13]